MNTQMAAKLVEKSVAICELCKQSQALAASLADFPALKIFSASSYDDLLPKLSVPDVGVVVLPLSENPTKGLDVLQKIVDAQPELVRIVLAGPLTPQQTARAAELSHHCLPVTCTPEALLQDITKSLHVTNLVNKPAVRHYINTIQTLPVLPDVYHQLNEALTTNSASARDISRILQQDPVMTAKIMQLVNSAFFGLSREISRVHEAVTILGVRMIRDLILSSHLFEAFPQKGNWNSFSFQQMHQRSMVVARAAQHIARSVKADRHVQAQAFLAGLLHDFGTIVLASQNPEEYRNILNKAELMRQPVYAIEKLELRVTHAEAGAYLLALWNLPPSVIEAVLLHHFPKTSGNNQFTPLTAVHVADSLIPSATSVVGCNMSSQLSMPYIQQIGMEKALDRWQIIVSEYQLDSV